MSPAPSSPPPAAPARPAAGAAPARPAVPRELLRTVRRIHLRTRRRVSDLFAGHYHSVFKGQGMEFHEVREYTPGDDIRAIDWNVTARMGHPYVKLFTEERESTVMLLADVSASNRFGSTARLKRDLAAELSALLALAAVQNNDRVGLILFSDEVEHYVPPRKGSQHVLRVVRDVLGHRPRRTGTRLTPALDFLNRVMPRRSVAFLFSDFLLGDEPWLRPLGVTARRHDLIGVRIADRREEAWPRAGLVWWEDAETGARRLVDTSHTATRRALVLRQQARRDAWRADLRRLGADAIEVYANEPYERELIRFFQARERRLKA